MKNTRGFEVQHFRDDYGLDCSIQESSAVEPHVWLGVHTAQHKVIWYDAEKYGINVTKKRDGMITRSPKTYWSRAGCTCPGSRRRFWQRSSCILPGTAY